MFKIFVTDNGNQIQILKTVFKIPKFYKPFSHINNLSKTLVTNPAIDFILDEVEELQSSKTLERKTQLSAENAQPFRQSSLKESPSVQISHPWPEWVEFMEQLLKKGYFDGIGVSFGHGEMGIKDTNQIRTACLNFARDRFDLIRHMSRKDIHAVAATGCPSLDRKVVNSGKRLRAHVGIDEGNVCSSCILRGDCEKAYVKAREGEGGRTVDVMRVILTYGLDSIIGSVENKPCLNKMVKASVRRLLKELKDCSMEEGDCNPPKAIASKWKSSKLESSPHHSGSQIAAPTKQGDWICPKCNFLNFARNIKCLRCDGLFQERLKKLGEDQDHLPLKKGDWICDKCNFLNFAKNTRCLQCKEKPPRRQINPGEWECESCNYINFRRNMVCLKCDHRRPKSSNSESTYDQATNDNGVFRYSRPYFGQEIQTEDAGVHRWKFVEDETESHNASNMEDEVTGLVDFPIAGGRSDLSRNAQKQATWKQEMAEKINSIARAKENADEFKSSIMQRPPELFEATDNEEMAEWFRHTKDPKLDNFAHE